MDLDFLSVIDEKAEYFDAISDYLWDNPESAFTEFKSAAKLKEALVDEGFALEENLAGIPTAFSGRFGTGKPVIGILAEFDALSGLGQEAEATVRTPDGNACGHGCGHNLLGAASLAAATAVKRWLEQTKHPGTVILYGCPGEEGGSGKAFMARDGVFDELDAAFCWHPDDHTYVKNSSCLANSQILFRFDGLASHAGNAPHLGRSALDALELMNMGVQFLREHIIDAARIHYAITDAGGFSPNVVQPHAEVLYLIRAPRNEQVQEIYERVCDIAKGAALMTGTTESHDFIKACSNIIVNKPMVHMLQEKMDALPAPAPTQDDIEFARKMTLEALTMYPKADPENPLHWQPEPLDETETLKFGSSDVGDVSWVCPTAQVSTCSEAFGTPGHSWQRVAQGKRPYAKQMMRYAAKCLAAGAVEMLTNPELVEKAKEDHRKRVGKNGYIPPIPKGVKPRSMDSIRK